MNTKELQAMKKKVQQEEVSKKRRPRPDDLLTAQSRLRSERVQEAVKKLRGPFPFLPPGCSSFDIPTSPRKSLHVGSRTLLEASRTLVEASTSLSVVSYTLCVSSSTLCVESCTLLKASSTFVEAPTSLFLAS